MLLFYASSWLICCCFTRDNSGYCTVDANGYSDMYKSHTCIGKDAIYEYKRQGLARCCRAGSLIRRWNKGGKL